ncbi:MAG: hypothetical protein LAP38_29080 [Acidobacteriia bacterium]|nr:hypothetical protein [Terriglobia bacterium]
MIGTTLARRTPSWLRLAVAVAAVVLPAVASPAVHFEQKGFVEAELSGFPQLTPNDRAHVVGDLLLRWEPSLKFHNGLTLFLGVDARTDSHHQVERDLDFSWWDRTSRRPLLSARRLSLLYRHKFLTLEFGKQFVRWGKTDVLNPTDRFAPKDYLRVVDSDPLPVTAGRVTLEKGSNSLDLVYVPRFTPARIPLLDQRWVELPAGVPDLKLRDAGVRFPGGPQFGIRWNRIAAKLETSLSFYQGYNDLPLLTAALSPAPQSIGVRRNYPNLRAFGGDAAIPLRWFTLKTEAEALTSSTPGADNYVLFVLQAERQWKEWLFVGGYVGDAVTQHGGGLQFAADRGFSHAFLGRASVNLAGSRSLVFEAVARQNGNGLYAKAEYSQAFGQHWRWSAMFKGIRGDPRDFLGQYRRNSFASIVARYSF